MKYWVYMNGEVPGSYTPQELVALKGFTMTSLVCPAEGEILEKNWRRSGEFSDIIKCLHERDAASPPSAPAMAQEAVMTTDVNAVIDTAQTRLFSHVSHLMKELETRREERALTVTLQRQLVELKDQLLAAQDKVYALEGRMPRIAELEEIVRKDETAIQNLENALKAREDGLGELRQQMEKVKMELETTKRRLGESINDLAIRNRLVDKLSRDLTEKELSLAKSLGVIRRLEEDLNRLCPVTEPLPITQPSASAPAPAAALPDIPALAPLAPEAPPADPPYLAPLPEKKPEASAPAESSAPAEPPPPQQPDAQNALVHKWKRFISKYDH